MMMFQPSTNFGGDLLAYPWNFENSFATTRKIHLHINLKCFNYVAYNHAKITYCLSAFLI